MSTWGLLYLLHCAKMREMRGGTMPGRNHVGGIVCE